MPLNVLLKPREIVYHLQDADAKAYFCQEGGPNFPSTKWGSRPSRRPWVTHNILALCIRSKAASTRCAVRAI